MGKAIKLKNEHYWDSSSIVHNKELLSTVIDNMSKDINNTGIGKITGTIPVGQYFQYPFLYFTGLAGLKISIPNYEIQKIFTVTVSNKYVGEIKELTSLEYLANSSAGIRVEVIDGAGDDIAKYIRVTNTGSVDLSYSFGVNNIIL